MFCTRIWHAQVCHLCLATKGRDDFSLVFTDVSAGAAWRHRQPVGPPWIDPPALVNLRGFDVTTVAPDLLHILNLGILRDLLGSAIKLMIRGRAYYRAGTIAKRLQAFSKDLRFWCKGHGIQLHVKYIRKKTLAWSGAGCPELHVKAADAVAVLRFVSHKLQGQQLADYPGLLGCVWMMEKFLGVLSSASMFLTAPETETVVTLGNGYINMYIGLANTALHRAEFYFKVRPKFHAFCHVLASLEQGQNRNVYYDACFMDEDWIKQAMCMARRMSFRTCAANFLRRFRVVLKKSLKTAMGFPDD